MLAFLVLFSISVSNLLLVDSVNPRHLMSVRDASGLLPVMISALSGGLTSFTDWKKHFVFLMLIPRLNRAAALKNWSMRYCRSSEQCVTIVLSSAQSSSPH